MKRALAVLVAVSLVVGALVVRARLDDGGEGEAPRPAGDEAAVVVACVVEAFDQCRDAIGGGVRRVTAGEALDALVAEPVAAADAEVDAWVLPRYVVDAVVAQRDRQGSPPVFGQGAETVAHTEVVPAGLPDRMAALEAACERRLDWACLAELAGRPWSELGQSFPDRVRLGVDPPSGSATGLVALGALSSAALGSFDPNQTDAQAWFQDLERRLADPPRGGPALAVLATQQGTYDVAAALLADAAQVAEANPRVAVSRPAPAAVFEVVVASGAGRRLDLALVGDLADELGRSGWAGGESSPSPLVPAGEVLAALRNISGR